MKRSVFVALVIMTPSVPAVGQTQSSSSDLVNPPWEYTRWGMTPQEVIAASAGKAWAGHSRMPRRWVEGEQMFHGRKYDVVFVFSSTVPGEGGLEKVALFSKTRLDCEPVAKVLEEEGFARHFRDPATGLLAEVSIGEQGCEIDYWAKPRAQS